MLRASAVFLRLTDNAAAGGTGFADSRGAHSNGSTKVIAAANSFS